MKIIQIIPNYGIWYCLCDDGSVWREEVTSTGAFKEWVRCSKFDMLPRFATHA